LRLSFSAGEPKEITLEGIEYLIGSPWQDVVSVLIEDIIVAEWSTDHFVAEYVDRSM